MARVSAEKILELVQRSGLDENNRTAEVVANLKQRGDQATLNDSERLAAALIEAKIVTRWQCDRLLEGRHKGFFLKQYKLLGLLGTGGMSSVYLGEHVLMQRLVAIKVLPQSRIDDTSYLARFHREAQAAASLDHQNIVRAYDIDNDGKNHYIVMEFVEGRDLLAVVKANGPLNFETAADYIRQAADGLEHAHRGGLIHRDIKPANLLVDNRGVVKVLDMGLARFVNETMASLTIQHDENVLGTADYLSPEQARDSHQVDARTDIYSLGCTLYYLLTGQPPFPNGTLAQRIKAHQTDTPASIYELRPDAPPLLVDICTRMMAKTVGSRVQTANEVSEAVSLWLQARNPSDGGGSSTNLGSPKPSAGGSSGSNAVLPRRSQMPVIQRRERTNATTDTISDADRNTIKGPAGSQRVRSGSDSDPANRRAAGDSSKSGSSSASRGGSSKSATNSKSHGIQRRPSVGTPASNNLNELFSEVGALPPGGALSKRNKPAMNSRAQAPWWIWYAIGGGALFVAILLTLFFIFGSR